MPDFNPSEPDEYPSISVIIPFRNEESNLPALLHCLEHLEYPRSRLEVIMINDDSTDKSVSVVEEACKRIPFLQLHSLQVLEALTSIPYKKRAIEKGISVSTGQWIITTDADCTFKKSWLKTIAAFINSNDPKCIAAPVRIDPERSLLSIFQSLDFLTLQGITGAAVNSQTHIMCNGANFAYTRTVFHEVNGFDGIRLTNRPFH